MNSEAELDGSEQAPEVDKRPLSDITLKQTINGGWTAEVRWVGASGYGCGGAMFAFTNTADLVTWISDIPECWEISVAKSED